MSKRIRRLLVCLLITLPLAAEADTPKSELQALRARLQNLQKEYQAAQESKLEVSDSLRKSELAISQATRQLHELENSLQTAQRELLNVNTQAQATQIRIREQQARLGNALKAAYQHGHPNALKLMLNGANPNQSARELHYLAALTRAQRALIDALRMDLAQLQDLQQSAADKTFTLAQIQAARQTEQQKLLADKRERQQVLQKLSTQIQKQGREIATLKRDQARLTQLVERLARVMARPRKAKTRRAQSGNQPEIARPQRGPVAIITDTPEPYQVGKSFAALKGSLHLPVQGELMNRFGAPRDEGGISWKGLFIRAASGAAVKAIASGQVVFSDWLRGFGNLIIVDHGEGYMSLYSNNESLYKQVGDAVRPGDALASVGNSGGQTESGLYFEMRHKSRPFNPLSWIK